MKKVTFAMLVLSACLARPASGDVLEPWTSRTQPADVSKRQVQAVTAERSEYVIIHGGTMDGQNCRSPQGVWQPFEQTWESNRSVRIENVGTTDVVNPWLANGRNPFRSLDAIVAGAVAPGMTDGDKARALWWQQIQHRSHFAGDNDELGDPVKVFNVYGYNTCGNDSICLAGLWRKAGLKVAPARLVGHCVSQVFFDGGWHVLDGDMHCIYLLRDNETVASEQDLVRDHDLIKRTHIAGILEPDGRAGPEWEASIYVHEGEATGQRNCKGDTTMHMTLRPGEALTWRWGHVNPVKYHGSQKMQVIDRVCNGLWEYRPDFGKDTWRKGATTVEGIKVEQNGLTAEPGKTGTITWTMRSPYVLVGGKLEVDGSSAKFALSWDGKTWEDIGDNFDKLFPSAGPARYQYYLRCQLSGQAVLKRLGIVNDLQMAPLTLPGMVIGKNTFVYTDQSVGDRKVKITHEWVERSSARPPAAPAGPIYPTDGGAAAGTDIAFQWKPSNDADGNKIADYHFELSARADMKWPLSMSFAKLISRTGDRGKAQYTLTAPGLLNPDRPYYWHVRAKNDKGVWGPWSATWTFTTRAPTPPLAVTLDYDANHSRGVLRWKPNPLGTKPARYRVYASDEKGFSVSEEPYRITVGISKDVPAQLPANFLTETQATELIVVGTEAAAPTASKAFYRVVAVDEQGKRSGPSDYAAAPRPLVTTKPVLAAKVGTAYRYQVSAIRSLGDLRTRVVNGKEVMNFWDIEALRFGLRKGPRWLKMDEATGVLSGIPDAAGKAEVEIEATLTRQQRKLDLMALSWGQEKLLATSTEKLGPATQKFVIDVAR